MFADRSQDFAFINMMTRRKKVDNTTEIGFEQQIWSAADKPRGNMDASEHKNVVLGLLFLRYISNKYGQRYQCRTANY